MDAELSGNKKEGGREPSILMRNLKEEDSSLILATGNMISERGRETEQPAWHSISFITRSPFAGLGAGHCFHKVGYRVTMVLGVPRGALLD